MGFTIQEIEALLSEAMNSKDQAARDLEEIETAEISIRDKGENLEEAKARNIQRCKEKISQHQDQIEHLERLKREI